jgi:addiction module RelE/StbE family toxin
MKTLVLSAAFVRAFKRISYRQPELRKRIQYALELLSEDPFHPKLHSHKLKGKFAGAWACTVDYDNRIIFELVSNPETGEEEILLQSLGTHDRVY